VPLRLVNNDTIISPAQEYSNNQNCEYPALYAVFPYRAYGIGKANLNIARNTFKSFTPIANGGWQQSSIQAAYLGFADEAKRMVVESFSKWNKLHRFPAFWGPNYDWTPDQDHGNVAMIALQRMIFQYEENNVYMMPAWPKEWDVRFKVNGPGNSKIEGVFENGKMVKMKITPESKIRVVQQ